jgi:peptidyl-prolyl cis-trans isomerase SurA
MAKKLYLLPIVCLLLAGGVRAGDDVVDEIVARVNDSIITRADVAKGKKLAQEELEQRYPSDWQSQWTERQKDVLRDLIDEQLLLGRGQELGIDGQAETVKRLDELRVQMNGSMDDLQYAVEKQGVSFDDFKEHMRRSVVAEQVIAREVGPRIHPSEQEMQAWYNQHQKDLMAPEAVELAEILVKLPQAPPRADGDSKDGSAQSPQAPADPAQEAAALAKAKDLLGQLRKGATFEDLAKKYSDGPTAAQGGIIGTFKRGEMARQLEDKVFALKPGEITDVIRTRQGFIIFRLLSYQPAGVPPLKDVSERIYDRLYKEKLVTAARQYLTKLREESYIEVRAGFVDTGASPNERNILTLAGKHKGD